MPVEQEKRQAITFDDKNPKTPIAQVAGIDETEAEQFISVLSLTDYVALVNAIQNKDVEQITDIFDTNEDKLDKIYEALDPQAMDQLRKISQKMPKVAVGSTTTTKTTTSTPNQASKAMNQDEIVSADSETGTVAVKDPNQRGKIDIKSIKNQEEVPEIETLMKNAGVSV